MVVATGRRGKRSLVFNGDGVPVLPGEKALGMVVEVVAKQYVCAYATGPCT